MVEKPEETLREKRWKAVEKTVEWSKAWMNGNDMELIMEKQILEYRDEREKEY